MLNLIGYTMMIGAVLFILYLIFAVIRASTSDSEKRGILKELFDILATLENRTPEEQQQNNEAEAGNVVSIAPFEEECPACAAIVTHKDRNCPSCDLRLIE